ncbi:MAG: hypothetical protein ACFBSE_22665 [Prochloraceae cyanobacterium]
MRFSNTPPDDAENRWRYQLDDFVRANERDLAGLAWGLLQEWGDSNNTLGIDLNPKPHFVACSREAIEKLNKQVNYQFREILGILDGYDRNKEVVIIGIGNGQIKLINFVSDPLPPVCYESAGDLDSLIDRLEAEMNLYIDG